MVHIRTNSFVLTADSSSNEVFKAGVVHIPVYKNKIKNNERRTCILTRSNKQMTRNALYLMCFTFPLGVRQH